MKIMHAYDEENVYINAINAMKEKLEQLKNQSDHCLSKLEGTMSKNTQVETLHDVEASKNELIKWLRETTEKLKSSADA